MKAVRFSQVQSTSRTSMRSSSSGTSLGFHWDSLLWCVSCQWKLGSSSSVGIHCLMACQGGSMGSKVSMSKGGSGGGGELSGDSGVD
jgi:hypothetical protein